MAAQADRRIPVLVVSGFLGSGKTTLVQHLLRQAIATGSRIAVISNEFGALGIDRALLGQAEDAYVELEGGCVCCQLSDELRDTLQRLRTQVDPDRIIVETSGVALPSDTQLQFWREPVRSWVEDDVAVVVVSAEQLYQGRDLHGTFEDQVSSADLLLLNQIDLVPRYALAGLDTVLHDMAPDTPILHTTYGRINPAVLFPPDPAGLRQRRRGTMPSPHHHEEFRSFELRLEAGITPAAVLERLRQTRMVRAKGFVCTDAGLRLVQGVGRRLELSEPPSPPPACLIGRVVIICRDTAENRGTHPPAC